VCVLPQQRSELHHGDESTKVHNLCLGVLPVRYPRQVKQLGALVDLGPESLVTAVVAVVVRGGVLAACVQWEWRRKWQWKRCVVDGNTV
jgi:hypothetical protein